MKSCFIIGSGPGVAEAIARRFGREGYRIGLVARNSEKLQKQQERLAIDGIESNWVVADAGCPDELETAINQLVESLGQCDVLVYNAAILRPELPLEISADTITEEFKVNVLGALQAAQLVAPSMLSKKAGAILFTGGGLALEPYPEWTSLALGKSALRSLSVSLYKTLAPKGIQVSVLAICGIVKPGGPFDPDRIAEEYWKVATGPISLKNREVIYQPEGSDLFYNDPQKIYGDLTIAPKHSL